MSGKLLLFGFETPMEVLSLVTAVKPMGVELVSVTRGDYGTPLGVLAGEDPAGNQAPYTGAPLNGRMIVLCGLEHRLEELLPVLAAAGAGPDCPKAVLTAHNRKWTPVTLYSELLRERQAMQRKGKR